MKVVSLISGGLDSVTMAYHYKAVGADLHCISFDYGQRHKKELEQSRKICLEIGVIHDVIDVTSLGLLLTSAQSSLVNNKVDVPEGHYAAETMKATIVPNRNAIMLSMAFGVAEAEGCDIVAFAAHGGDHFIYPDCRPDFISAFRDMEDCALDRETPTLEAPFQNWSKADIVAYGYSLGVPYDLTWSCYKGGDVHCGKCGTCVERAEAFSIACIEDPTSYEDSEFWKAEVESRAATVR